MSELNLDAYDEEEQTIVADAAEVDPAKVKDLTEIQACIDSIVSKLERGKVRNEEDELEIADWAVYFYGLSWSCRTETIAALAVFCALHKKVRVTCTIKMRDTPIGAIWLTPEEVNTACVSDQKAHLVAASRVYNLPASVIYEFQ